MVQLYASFGLDEKVMHKLRYAEIFQSFHWCLFSETGFDHDDHADRQCTVYSVNNQTFSTTMKLGNIAAFELFGLFMVLSCGITSNFWCIYGFSSVLCSYCSQTTAELIWKWTILRPRSLVASHGSIHNLDELH